MTDGSLALTLLRAVISLALVLGLLIACMRLLARRGGFSTSARVGVDVETLGRRQLSRGASVHVVRVGSKILVLGVTDSEVSNLGELSGDDVRADEETTEVDGTVGRVPTAAPTTLLEALRRQGQVGRLVADVTGRGRGGRHRGGSRV
ncbi:FliO/MopB family protein [Mobilicoccus massiliensis]|uniref:FliO/MopB family protein n=1 Tax=Mobilicoccus massiliensis TaxID=1522310 RepID=UPI0006937EDA|nr:flagellar biosynthetic protein FliO [Mobilicoccus massiliensis]